MARHNWPGVPGFESTRPSRYPVLHVGQRRRRRMRRIARRAVRIVLFPLVALAYLLGIRP